MGKLLDAYQEDLIQLEQLRQRMPELRKREQALRSELESLEATAADQEIFLRLAAGLESFLTRLRQSADTMSVMERQKVLRLVVKEIHVGRSTIQIKHSIPTNSSDRIGGSTEPPKTPSYLLRSGSRGPPFLLPLGLYVPSDLRVSSTVSRSNVNLERLRVRPNANRRSVPLPHTASLSISLQPTPRMLRRIRRARNVSIS